MSFRLPISIEIKAMTSNLTPLPPTASKSPVAKSQLLETLSDWLTVVQSLSSLNLLSRLTYPAQGFYPQVASSSKSLCP